MLLKVLRLLPLFELLWLLFEELKLFGETGGDEEVGSGKARDNDDVEERLIWSGDEELLTGRWWGEPWIGGNE